MCTYVSIPLGACCYGQTITGQLWQDIQWSHSFGTRSDDRSADVFRTKIDAATQMKAVLGADPRPNCLIIDEIDGAPQVREGPPPVSYYVLGEGLRIQLTGTLRSTLCTQCAHDVLKYICRSVWSLTLVSLVWEYVIMRHVSFHELQQQSPDLSMQKIFTWCWSTAIVWLWLWNRVCRLLVLAFSVR